MNADWVEAIGSVTTALAAVWGFGAWRAQMRGRASHDVAARALTSTIRVIVEASHAFGSLRVASRNPSREQAAAHIARASGELAAVLDPMPPVIIDVRAHWSGTEGRVLNELYSYCRYWTYLMSAQAMHLAGAGGVPSLEDGTLISPWMQEVLDGSPQQIERVRTHLQRFLEQVEEWAEPHLRRRSWRDSLLEAETQPKTYPLSGLSPESYFATLVDLLDADALKSGTRPFGVSPTLDGI